jgi:transcriptional regulator with XRE-family HTH domain
MSGKTKPIKKSDTQVVKILKLLTTQYKTQKKLAKELNVSLCSVSSWINKRYIPNEDARFAINALATYHEILTNV